MVVADNNEVHLVTWEMWSH